MGRSRFYFCAVNSIDRIKAGDIVLIDTASEIDPHSIILSVPDLLLGRADHVPSNNLIGKVVGVYIEH